MLSKAFNLALLLMLELFKLGLLVIQETHAIGGIESFFEHIWKKLYADISV